MKCVVVAASFSGDARDHLRRLGAKPQRTIIATPTNAHALEGLRGDAIETFWDIRRPGAYLGHLDDCIARMVAHYPEMDYRVASW
ncbi:hypothetical protein OG474_29885 [Kribbella sp. NBC_01505]|uniref:hypothetical protein n=1 Tax=Kribbella sp. NBC_01505 TaxID=2903580 RepID=UPI00386E47E5